MELIVQKILWGFKRSSLNSKVQAGLSWLYDDVFITSDTVVISNVGIYCNMSLLVHHLQCNKSIQNSCNKDVGKHISSFAPAEVIRCQIFSINGLAMHEQAVMGKLHIRGLKPLTSSSCPHISPPPQTLRSSAVCRHRLTVSSPAIPRSAFDFCHYTVCSL